MSSRNSVHIIGGGPAGLMAAEAAREAGAEVDLHDQLGSVGRKLLIAGKGGLNLTHSDPFDVFVTRYGERRAQVESWLREFDADALRAWAAGLGVDTFVGSSGRVFPRDLKAAPLLRAWVRRLRAQGVRFHVNHEWRGWNEDGTLAFATPAGDIAVHADALVLALGGASWPVLGSDGRWTRPLAERGIDIAPLRPSNCGFDIHWSAHFAQRHAGDPLKPVVLKWIAPDGSVQRRQGECVVTQTGLEGSLIYAFSAALRDAIQAQGEARITLDLLPDRKLADIERALRAAPGKRSLSEQWRRSLGLAGVKAGLVREVLAAEALHDPIKVASALKSLPLTLLRPRPIEEAISSAGGVRLEMLDEGLMLRQLPGVFCAGEMLDWEAPTGGYLLTACFASGRRAGAAAARWCLGRP